MPSYQQSFIMGEVTSAYNVLVVLAITFGSFTYGYCASILGNTFSKPSFYEYMNLELTPPGLAHTDSLIATWNSLLYVGGFIGCCTYPLLSSRFGRRIPLAMGSVFVIIGGAMQAGEVNTAMLCVARIITGLGIGNFLPGCPLYQAEVAPAHARGLMVGLHASVVGAGFALADWIGAAFFYVPGQVDWRVPLAIQCASPIAMLCIVFFLPESPRWLYLNGRADEAERVLIRLHQDKADPTSSYSRNEFMLMKGQIDLEAEASQSIWNGIKDPHLRKRFLVGFLCATAAQCSGSIVILTYSSVIYTKLGFSPFIVVILTGIWTTLLTVFNLIGGVLTDKIGRVKQLIIGLSGCLLCLIMSAILTALYADTDNVAGNRAATFFIFLFVCFFAAGVEAPGFVYTSEIFPAAWRASGVGLSMSAVQLWSAILIGSAAIAFENIGWKFYLVFVSSTTVMLIIVFLFFPETKGYSLEQVTKAFGDTIIEDLEGSNGALEARDLESKEPVDAHHELVFA